MMGRALVVAEKVAKLEVDHRLPLRIYYRAADSILRQAAIYRKENNLIELYVLLLRFSSLVMETIPQHRNYRTFVGREKQDFLQRVLDILNELEALKPKFQAEVSRYNNGHSFREPSSVTSSPVSVAVVPTAAPVYMSKTFTGTNTTKDPYKSKSWTVDTSSKPVESWNQGYPQLGHSRTTANNGYYDTGRQESSSAGYNWKEDYSNRPIDQGRQEVPGAGYAFAGDLSHQTFGVQRHEYSQARTTWIENVSCRPVELQRQYSQPGSILSQSANNTPFSSGSVYPKYASSSTVVNSMQNLSLSIPSARSETLSRHSFLGSAGLQRTIPSLVLPTKVAYPSLIDTSPIGIPSLDQSWRSPTPVPAPTLDANSTSLTDHGFVQLTDLIKLEEKQSSLVESAVLTHSPLVRQPSPPPVEVEVQSITATLEQELGCSEVRPCDTSDPQAELKILELPEALARPRKPKPLHVSSVLMEEFMAVARGNTKNNLETCGVLAGSLKEGMFYVTTLLIPKQEATSNSCSTTNEEELFEYQDKNELFQFGWIHTHPSQSCFMSSIDLHTHYSYQIMLPEAIAIVMAPTDSSRKYGIFRLSEPSGIKAIQSCDKRGFHPHDPPSDGNPIYESSYHVILNSNINCTVVDLR